MQSCHSLAVSFYQSSNLCYKDSFFFLQTLCQHKELKQLPEGTVCISSNVIRHLADGCVGGKRRVYTNVSLAPRHTLINVTTATHIGHIRNICTQTYIGHTSIARYKKTDKFNVAHTHTIPT